MAGLVRVVDGELEKVPADFKDPRFYALKHVVEILSSGDPKGLVGQLREQEERLELLVDKLVHTYHGGFAKSIQNYSQILQLFADAKDQVESLRSSLGDASRQLSAQSRHMQQQWRKSVTLQATTKLLEDVQVVVDAPARIGAALASKDWPGAVVLLLDGASKLAREELAKLGALRKLRHELSALCQLIAAQVMAELQHRVFSYTATDTAARKRSTFRQGTRLLSDKPNLRLASAPQALELGGDQGQLSHSPLPSELATAAEEPLMQHMSAQAAGHSSCSDPATGNTTLGELVGCLESLGALDEAHAYLGLHTRGAVRSLVTTVLEVWVQAQLARHSHPSPGEPSAGNMMGRVVAGVPMQLQASVSRLMEEVSEHCICALRNLRELLAELAAAAQRQGASMSVGLAVLKQLQPKQQPLEAQQQQQVGGGGDGMRAGRQLGSTEAGVQTSGNTAAAARSSQPRTGNVRHSSASGASGSPAGGAAQPGAVARGSGLWQQGAGAPESGPATELLSAWQDMQEEVQLLVAELLRSSLRGLPGVVGVAIKGPGLAWLADLASLGDKALARATGGAGSPATAINGPSAAGLGNSSTATGGIPVAGSAQCSRLSFAFELSVAGLELDPALVTAGQAGASSQHAVVAQLTVPEVAQSSATAASRIAGSATGKETAGYAGLLRRALGDPPGSPYLAPAGVAHCARFTVYPPVQRFVSFAAQLLEEYDSSSMAPFSGSPHRPLHQSAARAVGKGASPSGGVWTDGGPAIGAAAPQQQQEEVHQQEPEALVLSAALARTAGADRAAEPRKGLSSSSWLGIALEQFVTDMFLPQVWVDLRGRCTAALEDSEAFRAHIGLVNSCPSAPLQTPDYDVLHTPTVAVRTAVQSRHVVVPAARFAIKVAEEVMAWARAVPPFAGFALAGMLEALLGRVLEAAFAALQHCVHGTRAGELVLRPDVGLVAATEPDAVLLGEAMAFYVPRSQDAFNGGGFVTQLRAPEKPRLVPGVYRPPLKVRGLGLEGEPAAEELALLAWRERPDSVTQLLAGSRPPLLGQLVCLAALSESLDAVADALLALMPDTEGGLSMQGRRRGTKAYVVDLARGGGIATGASSTTGNGADALLEVMAHMVDRYRSLAGACVRAIRMDVQLSCAHYISALSSVSHIVEEEDVGEVHPAIGELTRAASRAAEECALYLPPRKHAYAFGCVGATVARCMTWLLQDIPTANALGVERMVRALAVAQAALQGLSAASTVTGSGNPVALGFGVGGMAESARLYERAKGYYTLVGVPASELVALATDKPLRFSAPEWFALLSVAVPGRVVVDGDVAAMTRALDKVYRLSAGQQVVEAFEQLGKTMQAPVLTLTENISAGIVQGVQQAKALLAKSGTAVIGKSQHSPTRAGAGPTGGGSAHDSAGATM